MQQTIEGIIQKLQLQPHPEGGFYRETYRSEGVIQPNSLEDHYTGPRNYGTAIYFLLTSDNFSAFHKIKQDEIWHFYQGVSIGIHVINPQGDYHYQVVGNQLEEGEVPQYVVEGGCWFAAEVPHEEGYSLVGCTVSPGFSFEDFEMASQAELCTLFPKHKKVIQHFTRH